jgi:hypothetical protein
MSPESLLVFIVLSIIVCNVFFTYAHVIVDENVSFESIGFTMSAVSDSPERQLLALLMVALFAYMISSLMYATKRTNESPVVSGLGLLACMLIFGTFLTRLSANATTHQTLAALTFLTLLLLTLAMTQEIYLRKESTRWQRYVTSMMTLGLIVGYITMIVVRFTHKTQWASSSARMLALLELVTFVTFAIVLFTYFNFD